MTNNMMKSAIPTTEEYESSLKTESFRKMERFSENFLNLYKKHLNYYFEKWVPDPLHQWSRQWEYLYVFKKIKLFINDLGQKNLTILDAGSGVTFFPYYIQSNFENTKIDCADYDENYEDIFKNINQEMKQKINFNNVSIDKTKYEDEFFDLIYCISVMEHTENFTQIIDEFYRILKPGGKIILTFDISLDGKRDISTDGASLLLNVFKNKFKMENETDLNIRDFISNPYILTTKYAYKIDTNLLWTPPPLYRLLLSNIKSLLMGNGIITFPPLLTVFCTSFTKA